MKTSELRANIYRVFDEILRTGKAVVIERNGRRLRIVPDESASIIERLQDRPEIWACDPDSVVELDWESEWSESDKA
ncbi:MAG: type II toxin-antitoxin system Phd/YefM family antitoxin [Myxococcales bacterium]|nr:MAG: type II toxin-antitoxin system Phd/YefM family antitoxin [Myxococcales bacterium]